MNVGCRVNVNEAAFDGLEALIAGKTSELIKALGTIYVRMFAAATPPHKGVVQSPQDRLKNKKHVSILKAREAVAYNIAGVAGPKEVRPVAHPVRLKNGKWDWELIGGSYKPRGFFGMLVPDTWRKQRGEAPPEIAPQALYKGARWDGKKMVPAQKFDRFAAPRGFVRSRALSAFIKEKQAHVGKLISGWVPAARFFATGKCIAPGFFEGLGGKGSAHTFTDKKGFARGVIRNAQAYNVRQAARLEALIPRILAAAEVAREKQIENIFKHFLKKRG